MSTYTVALRSMRSRVRNTVRDVLIGLYRKALAHPTGEPHPFPSAPRKRTVLTGSLVMVLNHPDTESHHNSGRETRRWWSGHHVRIS